jgi:hypothetical protein
LSHEFATTLQFIVVMIASAIDERLQRKLDYVEEERRILQEQLDVVTSGKKLSFTAVASRSAGRASHQIDSVPLPGQIRERAVPFEAPTAVLGRNGKGAFGAAQSDGIERRTFLVRIHHDVLTGGSRRRIDQVLSVRTEPEALRDNAGVASLLS